MEASTTERLTPHQRRLDLAKRIDLAREVLRPAVARQTPEARVVRSAFHMLAEAARELVEDDDYA